MYLLLLLDLRLLSLQILEPGYERRDGRGETCSVWILPFAQVVSANVYRTLRFSSAQAPFDRSANALLCGVQYRPSRRLVMHIKARVNIVRRDAGCDNGRLGS